MFHTLLIANRGEIACRVMRTCRRLGIKTVAVYSDADATARHVREADQAVRIGAAAARSSYLDAQAVLQAALATGAQAIHPGYGFLSEKLELIDACAAAGISFIGPHREAIARMGSKIESKRIARAAGVACVPGYDGDDQSDARLKEEAARIGFPLLIKASAGGGGKGMKRVDALAQFETRLTAARHEALAAFSDAQVLLERYIERPRHLEVQLLGDRHGGLVHLFERECSIQRNFQKIIEEAPAHHLSDAVREQLFAAALQLGRAIGYDSAGTVEFVLDADQNDTPYFLEMNTRLQVEHPVTELTVGLDLVEAQIRSAAGEALGFTQSDIRRNGWAIEARVNAEVPGEGFAASFGAVTAYAEPAGAAGTPAITGLRIDAGIDAHSEITPHYDAMLAKVIAHGGSRAIARERLLQGIRGLHIGGVRTNQALLADLVQAPAFDAVLTTRYLVDGWPQGWQPSAQRQREDVCAAAAAWFFAKAESRRAGSDLPLDTLTGFRLGAAAGRRASHRVCVRPADDDSAPADAARIDSLNATTVDVVLGSHGVRVTAHSAANSSDGVTIDGRHYRVAHGDESLELWCDGDTRAWAVLPEVLALGAQEAAQASGDSVTAELPGVVAQILVAPGQAVTAGMPVIVLEAMKLFHTLAAPRDGLVDSLPVSVGQTVPRGAVLLALAANGAAAATPA